jgi:hypothetical protein
MSHTYKNQIKYDYQISNCIYLLLSVSSDYLINKYRRQIYFYVVFDGKRTFPL